jgi:hypothetical protein
MNFCDRVSRRGALQVGALGTLGLGLPELLRSHARASSTPESTFGRAKRVILLFMWGGPAHQDTWDLKPEGPEGTRGEFLPIATNVPGIDISEHFPLLSRHADKLAIIRSVGQEDNNHSTGAHAGLTGRRHELKAESFGARETDFPHFGSVLTKLAPARLGLPTFVALPEVIATTNGAITPGQGGGFLGKKYDPFQIPDHPDRADFAIPTLQLPPDLQFSRMQHRRNLLHDMEQVASLAERSSEVVAMDAFYQQALDMVLSPRARVAFDLSSESEATRMRYGWHAFGQSVLMARRLAEAGVKLITVYWHREKKTVDSTWDTHALNFQELKNRLMPSVDRPIAALLEDLQARGLLDETLVVWNSEFGRTPRINASAGRDHWGACNSVVMAGGGMPGGQVFGASDAQAAAPISEKVTQDEIAATIYHLLGIEPETLIHDLQKRPFPVALGEPIYKLLGAQSPAIPAPPPQPRERIAAIGPFTRMLRERGNRFLCLECGIPDSEKNWQVGGSAAPAGPALQQFRALGTPPGEFKYLGHFYPHFDYEYLVLRLAEPQSLAGVKLTLGGQPLPIPEDLTTAPPRLIWQIPFPNGLILATKSLDLAIAAPGWKLRALALAGEEIRDLHLRTLEA